jgi:sRNA-binding carbon storage regulator CsrA|tara:strand:- start:1449 stop:1661 length:213 start_codon:yes stop_codon:yes gene_type:complete
MPLKLRLKAGDKLVLGSAFLEVERVAGTTVSVSVEAPQEIAIFKQRKTCLQEFPDSPKLKESSNDKPRIR